MLIRISLLSLLAFAACSDDPKPAEPVATEATNEPPLQDDPTNAEASVAEEAPAEAPAAIAPKAGTKDIAPVVAVKAVEAKPVTVTPADVLWVFVDGANVRATPSLAGKVVGKLAWGDKLTSLGTTDGFVKIGDGKFVHRKMLTDRKNRFGADKSAH